MTAPAAERVTVTSALATTLMMRMEPLGFSISRPEAEMLAYAVEIDFDFDFKNPAYRIEEIS